MSLPFSHLRGLLGLVFSTVLFFSLALAFEVEDMPGIVEAGKSYEIKWKDGSALVLVTYESPFGGRLIQSTSEDHYEWTIPIDIPLGNNYRIALHSTAKQVTDHVRANNFTIRRGDESISSRPESTVIPPLTSSIRTVTAISTPATTSITTSSTTTASSAIPSSEESNASEALRSTSLQPILSTTSVFQRSSTASSTTSASLAPPTPIAHESPSTTQNLSKAGIIGISTGATMAGVALLALLFFYLRRVLQKRKPIVVLDEFHVHPNLPELLSIERPIRKEAETGWQNNGARGMAELEC